MRVMAQRDPRMHCCWSRKGLFALPKQPVYILGAATRGSADNRAQYLVGSVTVP